MCSLNDHIGFTIMLTIEPIMVRNGFGFGFRYDLSVGSHLWNFGYLSSQTHPSRVGFYFALSAYD
jgi:hypothetical protein